MAPHIRFDWLRDAVLSLGAWCLGLLGARPARDLVAARKDTRGAQDLWEAYVSQSHDVQLPDYTGGEEDPSRGKDRTLGPRRQSVAPAHQGADGSAEPPSESHGPRPVDSAEWASRTLSHGPMRLHRPRVEPGLPVHDGDRTRPLETDEVAVPSQTTGALGASDASLVPALSSPLAKRTMVGRSTVAGRYPGAIGQPVAAMGSETTARRTPASTSEMQAANGPALPGLSELAAHERECRVSPGSPSDGPSAGPLSEFSHIAVPTSQGRRPALRRDSSSPYPADSPCQSWAHAESTDAAPASAVPTTAATSVLTDRPTVAWGWHPLPDRLAGQGAPTLRVAKEARAAVPAFGPAGVTGRRPMGSHAAYGTRPSPTFSGRTEGVTRSDRAGAVTPASEWPALLAEFPTAPSVGFDRHHVRALEAEQEGR